MANTKVTKKDYLVMIQKIVGDSSATNKADILTFIDHEIELLDKKSDKSKETYRSAANTATLDIIKEVLSSMDKMVTISELLENDRLKTYVEKTKDGEKEIKMTNQKLSSLIKKLVDAKEVIRTEEKKKAYFSLAKADIGKIED